MNMLFGIIGGEYSFAQNLVIIIAFGLAIVIALVAHEFAHAWMALKQGDPSAKLAGRMSFNPARHFEPLGLLCFIVVGIGWAKPVPVNPFNYRNFRRGNFWVSISGVLANLIIGFLFSFGYFMLLEYGNAENLLHFGLYYLCMLGMVVNISLLIFNLLPIPPLDGYNVLVSFTKPNNSFMKFMRENTLVILLVVMVFGGYIIGPLRDLLVDAFANFWGMCL